MSKIKKFFKEKWAYIVAALVFIGSIITWLLLRSPDTENQLPTPVQKAKEKLHTDLSKVRIDAAVEIAKARGKEEVVKEEIEKITKIVEEAPEDKKDEAKKKQLQALADLSNRY